LRHWLRRVTRDTCARQRHSRVGHHLVDPHLLAETALLHHDPETEYLRKERHEELHRAVGRLTDPVDRRAAQYYLGRDVSPVEDPGCDKTAPDRSAAATAVLPPCVLSTGVTTMPSWHHSPSRRFLRQGSRVRVTVSFSATFVSIWKA